MSEIHFPCDNCGQKIPVDESFIGSLVDCPLCGKPAEVLDTRGWEAIPRQDVFVSYRRDGGEHLSRRVMEALQERGFSVFVDVEDLKSGKFSPTILRKIELATDVIVICTKDSLDRCANEDDWVRKEVRYAIRQKKNIVPVFERHFVVPQKSALPADIAELVDYNALTPTPQLWEASMDRLVTDFLESKSSIERDENLLEPVHALPQAVLFGLIACFGIMLGVSLHPFTGIDFVVRQHPGLAPVCQAALFFFIALDFLILIGAGLTYGLNASGLKLVKWSALSLMLTNTLCAMLYFIVARKYALPAWVAGGPPLFLWIITGIPLGVVIKNSLRLSKEHARGNA